MSESFLMPVQKIVLPEPPKVPEKPWRQINHGSGWGYHGLTVETLRDYKRLLAFYEHEVREYNQHRYEILHSAIRILKDLGYPETYTTRLKRKSRFAKFGTVTLEMALTPFIPYRAKETPSLTSEEQWLADEKRKHEANQLQADKMALRDRAITWLISQGWFYGSDFTAENAVKYAYQQGFTDPVLDTLDPLY